MPQTNTRRKDILVSIQTQDQGRCAQNRQILSSYAIYALTDPRNEDIRYIGMSNNVMRRYQEHIRYIDTLTSKGQWIIDLYSQNLVPGLLILAVVDNEAEARREERECIERYGKRFELLNFAHNTANMDGGTRIDDPEIMADAEAKIQREREWYAALMKEREGAS